jgi:hypothetical protein
MAWTWKPARIGAWMLGIVLAAAGCDVQRMQEMEVGVSTESDVRAKWGEAAALYDNADGSRSLEYPRQPSGQVNYMIEIGADGKLKAIRQVLKPDQFAKVTPGLDKAQVRRLIGKPAAMQSFEAKREEVWDWRWLDNNAAKLFSVTFSTADGKVAATAVTDDTAASGINRN